MMAGRVQTPAATSAADGSLTQIHTQLEYSDVNTGLKGVIKNPLEVERNAILGFPGT